MKVAIDIRRVRDFGVGTYTRNLVKTLAGLDLKTSFTLVGTTSDRDELERLPENFSLVELDPAQRGARYDLRLSWALRRHRIELYHSPYLTTPWGLPCRRVVTVHDTADFLDMLSDGNSLPEVLRFQRTRRSLHRADRILTVSHAARRELQQIFSLPQGKIDVVYNALDARLEKVPSRVERERILTRYSAHDPYLLYAGNVRPHKNLPRLIEAYALVKDELRDHPRFA
ncbi:MAG: glycosyltransferase, partial [Terriglobia bacterium]